MQNHFIEKQIDLGNCIISYLASIGDIDPDLAPILFISGWAVLVEPYQESLNILSNQYQVIAPDLPGLGKSTAPNLVQDYSDYAELIIDFLNALNLKQVHVIGHSLGGAIGMALAALKPSIARSLIVVDSTGIPLGSVPEIVLRRLVEMPAQAGQMKANPVFNIFKNLFLNSLLKTQRIIQMAKLGIEKDVRPVLPRITCPCLVLWGANDLLTPATFAQEFSQGIKGSQLIILDGLYHEWMIFFPHKFTGIVSNFLQNIEENQQFLV